MFYIMTITSVWNGKRSNPVSVTGEINGSDKTEEQIYKEIFEIAHEKWFLLNQSTSSDRFVTDFYYKK